MSQWVKETLQQRFDLLVEQAEMLPDVLLLLQKLNSLEHKLVQNLCGDKDGFLKEWIITGRQITFAQKEWMYTQGVQDGMKMLIFFQKLENEEMFLFKQ